jgi:alpha-glucosidase (family GH31 glycosyl hydrolase)
MPADDSRALDIALDSGAMLRVLPVSAHVFRVRLRPDGQFPEPGLVRYGVIRADTPDVPVTVTEPEGAVCIDTGQASLTVSRTDGRMTLRDAAERVLVEDAAPPQAETGGGFRAELLLGEDERLYGLGDEARDRLNKRGHETPMVLRNVVSYAPIPFLMSTGGWAIFVNSTWFHHVDAGATDPDRLVISSRRGELDCYLIAGQDLPELLDHYTQITGRPTLLPLWGYGLTWVCDERGARARDVLYEANRFRTEGIPLDAIGLEPGWMQTRYDFSVDKEWNEETFHQPVWKPHQDPGGFVGALSNMGFKLSLWLCCDYDLSEYEESLLRGESASDRTDPGREALLAADRYDEDVIRDPHFIPKHQDTITKSGEAWFEHLKKFVDNGAAAFKMDGANQVCFHPDRKWRNGMEDEEMHNLYPVLLAKQMSQGFAEHTGRRAMIYTAGGYAGIQQYAATWAGDTGGGDKPLTCILNHGLSGHSNTSCDMEVWHLRGIHFGFLQPWSQILCWHQYNQPWFLPPAVYAAFKFYARLRYRLLPYLYSAAHVAARTGMPMMRAMPLVAPDDPKSDELLGQYMLGEWLLTCAFTDTIHLPAGRWIDYWTGEAHEGPRELACEPPAGRGGPLFVKAGAIIPTWPAIDYVGQIPIETVGLEVFPHGASEFTLYEDNGITLAYLDGEVATTHITCEAAGGEVAVTIGPREGSYDGMTDRREWDLSLHLDAPPAGVIVNGSAVTQGEDGWRYDQATGTLRLQVAEDTSRSRPAIIAITGQ